MSTNTSPKVLLSPQEGNVDEWARETGAELIRAGVFQLRRLPSASEEELAKLDLSARMKWDETVHRLEDASSEGLIPRLHSFPSIFV